MTPDYFLLIIALIWCIFASIQDLRSREVSNWLNFSLLGFALIFRFGESYFSGNWNYLLFGIVGAGIYFGIANLFYYTKVFAGGDAKLLWALGAVFPYNSWMSLAILLVGFLVLFMIAGVFYTCIYSLILIRRNAAGFRKEFWKNTKQNKWIYGLCWLFCVFILFLSTNNFSLGYIAAGLIFILPALYCGLKAVETACLICYVSGEKLTEGDWLDKPIKINGKWIGKSVHGLSKEDIKLIKKSRKKVWLKQGIPFVPVFLISLGVMLYVFSSGLLYQVDYLEQMVSLFLGF